MNIKIPTAKEDSIPELNKLKRNFAKLISSANEYQNKSTKDILDCIKTAYGGITRPIHFTEWETCKDITGYRIISEADFQENNLILENPSSFSFPENPKLGRANLPGFPVLYASDNAHTAVYEKIASDPESFIGEKFYLSEWRLKPETSMNTILLLYGIEDPQHYYYEVAQGVKQRISSNMKIYSKKGEASLSYLMSSMGNLFMQRDWHLSSALANHWLYSNRELNFARVDCLIYPSVQKDKSGINFAFHPHFVREQMSISSVKKIQLDKFNMEGLNFLLKEIGAIHGEKINWHTARFTFKRVDLLDKDWKSIKAFSQREIYENQFGFDDEKPLHLPTKLISILRDKIQIDLELTLANKTINPKPYRIKFEQEVEIEGMKAFGMGCYIEYLYENL